MREGRRMQKRLGRQTVVFEAPPRIAAGASIVGDVEGAGPFTLTHHTV